MDLAAKKLAAEAMQRYSTASSYQDVAIVEKSTDKWSSKTLTQTFFKKPDQFKFERRFQSTGREGDTCLVVWFDGKNGYFSDTENRIHRIFPFDPRKTKAEKLDECLIQGSLFAQPIGSLTHSLLLTGTTMRMPILRYHDWQFVPTSDSQHFALRRENTFLQIAKESGLVDSYVSTRESTFCRIDFKKIQLNETIDETEFDMSKIEKDIKHATILLDLRKCIGDLRIKF